MAQNRGRRRIRLGPLESLSWVIVGVVCIYALARSVRHGFGTPEPVDLAALIVGILALVQGISARVRQDETESEDAGRALAARLARQVLDAETAQFRQLIGGDSHRINLAFARRVDDVRPAANPHATGNMYAAAGDPAEQSLPDVRTYYQSTLPKRLVITGEAGAGKTALALELLLALVEDRHEDDPVPLRMGLTQFDTKISVAENLTSHLVTAYNWRRPEARKVVGQGRVLPVLDGLDEMDPPVSGVGIKRSRLLLESLNAYQRGRFLAPVILTCRAAHYDAVPRYRRLRDAARVELAPVHPEKACTYLAGRAIDPHEWQPVLDEIRRPASVLGVTLSNPWRLSLAATVFAHEGNPADLLRVPAATDPDAYLLARLIPASTGLAHDPRRYKPADVHRWLARLAACRSDQEATAGQRNGTSIDLVLHRIWSVAGTVLPRLLHVLVIMVGAAAFADFVVGGLDRSTSLFWALLSVPAILIALRYESAPRRFDVRRAFTLSGLRQAARGGVIGVLIAVGVGIVFALVVALATGGVGREFLRHVGQGFGFGLFVSPAASIYLAFSRGLPDLLTPRDPLRNDLRFGIAFGLLFWISYGAAFWPVYKLLHAWQEQLGVANLFETSHVNGQQLSLDEQYREHGPLYGFSSGVTADVLRSLDVGHASIFAAVSGLIEAFILGIAIGSVAWTRYAIAVALSALRWGLPLRLGAFLDWSYQAGILRISGISYQFRHLELQNWLMQHPVPRSAEESRNL